MGQISIQRNQFFSYQMVHLLTLRSVVPFGFKGVEGGARLLGSFIRVTELELPLRRVLGVFRTSIVWGKTFLVRFHPCDCRLATLLYPLHTCILFLPLFNYIQVRPGSSLVQTSRRFRSSEVTGSNPSTFISSLPKNQVLLAYGMYDTLPKFKKFLIF